MPARKHGLHAYWIDPDSGCWDWFGSKTKGGYGQGSFPNATSRLAHRWHYEQKYGRIPKGMQLDHTCRNRGCVNPDHLEPVTNAENQRRGDRAILTESQVRAIKQAPRYRGLGRDLAERYGVHEATICAIRHGRLWPDVT